MVGCGGGGESATEMPLEEVPDVGMAADESFSCMDTSGLTPAEAAMRTTLEYTDTSPETDKNCKNCVLYEVPVEGSDCGTCQTVKGPIHPLGYCTIWAALPA